MYSLRIRSAAITTDIFKRISRICGGGFRVPLSTPCFWNFSQYLNQHGPPRFRASVRQTSNIIEQYKRIGLDSSPGLRVDRSHRACLTFPFFLFQGNDWTQPFLPLYWCRKILDTLLCRHFHELTPSVRRAFLSLIIDSTRSASPLILRPFNELPFDTSMIPRMAHADRGSRDLRVRSAKSLGPGFGSAQPRFPVESASPVRTRRV
jgi:hypothetical protein